MERGREILWRQWDDGDGNNGLVTSGQKCGGGGFATERVNRFVPLDLLRVLIERNSKEIWRELLLKPGFYSRSGQLLEIRTRTDLGRFGNFPVDLSQLILESRMIPGLAAMLFRDHVFPG